MTFENHCLICEGVNDYTVASERLDQKLNVNLSRSEYNPQAGSGTKWREHTANMGFLQEPPNTPLTNGRKVRSRKNGKLTGQNVSVRTIGGRDTLGIWELSPHDLHHLGHTAAKNSDPFTLRDAGGWTNMQTPGRYIERATE